jgi:ABC-2 type transport system permease protein
MNNVNWLGLWTLYKKEVMRFLHVYNQTLAAPLVNALLLLAVFSLALQSHAIMVEGIPFKQFIFPGLVMMVIIQNAFANTSSTLTFGKVLGTMIDYLLPPISAAELTFASAMGGVTRGLMCGLVVGIVVSFFIPVTIYSFFYMVLYAFLASLLLSLIGMVTGIFSDSFDQMSAITSYIITPLSFLSCTFYSVNKLPEFWQHISHLNPFFYMIDGFRYSLTGYHDSSIALGLTVLISLNIILYYVVYSMINSGYRLKG